MNEELWAGLAVTFTSLAGVGYLMLRKNAGIFRMFLAMLVVGLGYLSLTGAMSDIGAKILGRNIMTPAEEPAPAVAPAADKSAPPTAGPAEEKAAPAPAAVNDKAPEPAPAAAEDKKVDAAPAPADPDVDSDAQDTAPPPPPAASGAAAPQPASP